ncbi:MAG: hypothetical protein SF187_10055 [Deltaproteobacteria bacterium]|nr:hypothetical protein [Deltaproteobacteria bacterium]
MEHQRLALPWHHVVKIAVAGALALGLGACPSGDEPDPSPGGCFDGKDFHKTGTSFPASDGCNTCSCGEDGNVACTLIACGDPGPGGCSDGKTNFSLGASFPALDGCNKCTCTKDGIACTEIACAPDQRKCVRGGCSGQLCVEEGSDAGSTCEWREEYACFAKAACERQANGECGHTPSKELDACLAATGSYCSYNSEWHKVGESFPSTDKCNTCTCGPEGVSCTKKLCIPDEPAPQKCVRTGCSGQLCADAPLISTCEFRPEYACYQKATCERQKNGQCGFTPTNELVQCLGNNGTCLVDGKTYPVGATAPAGDRCNQCVCGAGGVVVCTARACAAP